MSSFQKSIDAFDAYNSNDPNKAVVDGITVSKELLYAQRMSIKLGQFNPAAPEHVKLAARCQHIGRWELPRSSYPEGRKGYLQWRATLQKLHAEKAGLIMISCGYDAEMIDKVKFTLQKKQLNQHHPDTQLLEDIICLVFIEFYLTEFASKHPDEKVIDILQKTLKKMSPEAVSMAHTIRLPEHIEQLLQQANR